VALVPRNVHCSRSYYHSDEALTPAAQVNTLWFELAGGLLLFAVFQLQSRLQEDCVDGRRRFHARGGGLRLVWFALLILALACRLAWLCLVDTIAAQHLYTPDALPVFLADRLGQSGSTAAFVVFTFLWAREEHAAPGAHDGHHREPTVLAVGGALALQLLADVYLLAAGRVDAEQSYKGDPVFEVASAVTALATVPLAFQFAALGRRRVRDLRAALASKAAHERSRADRRAARARRQTVQVVAVCLCAFLLRSFVFLLKPLCCLLDAQIFRHGGDQSQEVSAYEAYEASHGSFRTCLRYLEYNQVPSLTPTYHYLSI
jgi:hypothetical protein